uniref:thioredoxin-dependent peroxiredoxin n=1 Tax=Acrobeloides nanus TaxID=290746 RepID=A0A914C584_9BILA
MFRSLATKLAAPACFALRARAQAVPATFIRLSHHEEGHNEAWGDFYYGHQGIRPIGPTTKAPAFEGQAVVNGEFKTISLNDYKDKWLIFFFYPLDFTFVCPTEIIAFGDRAAEFRKLNTELVACSCDSHFSHLAWINTPRKDGGLGDMQIPVLSDFSKKIARDFGVLCPKTGLSYRGLFLIDPKGIVRYSGCNDLPVGRSVDETLRLLKAFQFFEKHGEVCPADWEEGEESINTKNPKKYFGNKNK